MRDVSELRDVVGHSRVVLQLSPSERARERMGFNVKYLNVQSTEMLQTLLDRRVVLQLLLEAEAVLPTLRTIHKQVTRPEGLTLMLARELPRYEWRSARERRHFASPARSEASLRSIKLCSR